MLPWESKFDAKFMVINGKIFWMVHHSVNSLNLSLKTPVLVWKKMINRKRNCENEVSRKKLLFQESSILNDGIGEASYLLQNDFICTNSTKSNSLHRCFFTLKKHKALNKRLSSS